MLVLSRKKGEELAIVSSHFRVQVRVLTLRGGRVWLGIAAPDDVVVCRQRPTAAGAETSPGGTGSGNAELA